MPSSLISPTSSFTPRLAAFAADLTAKFAIALHFNPEDQLKAPMLTLLTGVAEMLGLTRGIESASVVLLSRSIPGISWRECATSQGGSPDKTTAIDSVNCYHFHHESQTSENP